MATSFSTFLLVALTLTAMPAWAQAVNRAANTPAAAASSEAWTSPRTPDGQPDLQGVWDYRTATPLERPKEPGDRAFLTDEEIWERCITRGLPEGMLPAGYNNNLQIVQTPTHVVLVSEMIHDAIVPIDGRSHVPQNVRTWTGDLRGHFEGDTLVIETTIEYRFTVEDPTTWSRSWTVTSPMLKNDEPMFEYACHEGNYGLKNILGNARAAEKDK